MGSFLRRHRRVVPYLLLAPGILWLVVFYVVPGVPDVPHLALVGHAGDRLRVRPVERLELHRCADQLLAAVLALDRCTARRRRC